MGFKDKLRDQAVDLNVDLDYIKALIYGESGIGKTVLSATASVLDGDLFFISAEKGTISVKSIKFQDRIKLGKIKVVKLDNFIDFNDYYEFLFTHCELIKQYDRYVRAKDNANAERVLDNIWVLEHDVARPKGQMPRLYRTVVVDSLTEAQKKSMDRIVDLKHKVGSEGYMNGNLDFDGNTVTLPDYGTNTQQMRKLVRAFRDLDMNVIFTALEVESKDDNTGEVRVRPAMTDKLCQDVLSFVDIVGRYYVSTSKDKDGKPITVRKMLTQPYGKYIAKDRTGTLGLGLSDPTFEQISKLVKGGIVNAS